MELPRDSALRTPGPDGGHEGLTPESGTVPLLMSASGMRTVSLRMYPVGDRDVLAQN